MELPPEGRVAPLVHDGLQVKAHIGLQHDVALGVIFAVQPRVARGNQDGLAVLAKIPLGNDALVIVIQAFQRRVACPLQQQVAVRAIPFSPGDIAGRVKLPADAGIAIGDDDWPVIQAVVVLFRGLAFRHKKAVQGRKAPGVENRQTIPVLVGFRDNVAAVVILAGQPRVTRRQHDWLAVFPQVALGDDLLARVVLALQRRPASALAEQAPVRAIVRDAQLVVVPVKFALDGRVALCQQHRLALGVKILF